MPRRLTASLFAAALLLAGCGSKGSSTVADGAPSTTTAGVTMPTALNVYRNDGVNNFVDATRNVPPRLYVPNSDESSVSIIDPATNQVIDTIQTGKNPQHVVPSWDLKTLSVTNNQGNSLTPIDPMTAKRSGADIPVEDPYNMYFTPDGSSAIVVAEALQNLDFRDPKTFALQKRVHVNCPGVDHIDFAADNKSFVATCEFSGKLVQVSLPEREVTGYLTLREDAMPQDIKLDPTGTTYYVADMMSNGVWTIDAKAFTKSGFLPTGPEAHGLYPSRDAKYLYVSNRGGMGKGGNQGSVSVIDFSTGKVVNNWPIAPPSTPDMGNVSADGKTLWLAGRRSGEVYGIDTTTGALTARVKVGKGPHGMAVWPQPGTYSLGHTGILR